MVQFALVFIQNLFAIYGLLIGIYYALGVLVTDTNKHWVADRKIQSRESPPDLIRRDILQSTLSLVQIASFFAAGIALRSAGFGVAAWRLSPVSFLIAVALSMVFFDTWFYWGHRLLHTRLLYKRLHQWHHVATTPTVWSNNSDTFLDNMVLQSYWLFAPLFLPAPTAVFVVHKIYDQASGMIGHSGYEYNASTARFPSPLLAVTHHDQHHRYFKYNYAVHFVIWDRLMHTLHPGYDRSIAADRGSVRSGPAPKRPRNSSIPA
jgi:sterol desaturase/sphingolipid hydroxylase (fatty acid hydroxylase superfamily)